MSLVSSAGAAWCYRIVSAVLNAQDRVSIEADQFIHNCVFAGSISFIPA